MNGYELLSHRQAAADGVIDAIRSLPSETQASALNGVIDHLNVFRDLGRVDQVRELLPNEGLSGDRRRRLVIKLDDELSFLQGVVREGHRPPHKMTPAFEEWRKQLSTNDLAIRVQDLTARTHGHIWDDKQNHPHADLARELIDNPNTFRSLQDWFNSPEPKSVGELGFHAGRLDTCGSLAGTVREWLRDDRCRTLTVTYLNGAGSRDEGLPDNWTIELDALAALQPELVGTATLTADVSIAGLMRLLGIVERLPPPASRFLRPLAYGSWHTVLTLELQARVLATLNLLACTGDALATSVGLDLLDMWWHRRQEPLDALLVPATVDLASRHALIPSDSRDHHWLEVLKLLLPHRPAVVARLIIERVTDPNGMLWSQSDPVVEVMAAASASDPTGAMEVVGNALLDEKRRPMFGVAIYRGLFESIGLDAVREWVSRNGNENVKWFARHLKSPFLNQNGDVVVPLLTKWLFEEHETDQRAFEWFLMGRSDGAHTWMGDRTEEKREEMRPFADHTLRRVRDWAEYELQREIRDVQFFQRWDDESGRV